MPNLWMHARAAAEICPAWEQKHAAAGMRAASALIVIFELRQRSKKIIQELWQCTHSRLRLKFP